MKQNKSLMIFLSLAIGSGIGVMLASQFKVYWWLGVLIGGLVGYLVYDFKQIIAAAPIAWKNAVQYFSTKQRMPKVAWKKVGQFLGTAFLIIYCVAIPGVFFWYNVSKEDVFIGKYGSWASGIWVGLISVALILCYFLSITLLYLKNQPEEKWLSKLDSDWIGVIKVSRITSVVRFGNKHNVSTLMFLIALPMSAILTIRLMLVTLFYYLPRAIAIVVRFIWKLFKLIHSDIRLLVGIDSIVGGSVGHFCHNNVLIGMAVGAVWGLINYQIVSLRILKLKPKH